MKEEPFFVGYLGVPKGLKLFLVAIAAAVIAGAGAFAATIALTQDDPGDGAFRFDLGRQTVTGVIELTPTPILHVTEGSEHVQAGHTLMLSGGGKNGALPRARALDGQMATASGVLLARALDPNEIARSGPARPGADNYDGSQHPRSVQRSG